MKFGTRWQRVTSLATIWAWKDKVYHDEDEKFTAEDIDETLYAVAYLGLIWSPQIALAIPAAAALGTPLAIVEGAVIAGAVASFAIGGLEGVETYVDYISDPVDIVTDPGKREALITASDVMLSLANPFHIPSKMAGEWLGENLPWGELFRTRWVTGPYLPF